MSKKYREILNKTHNIYFMQHTFASVFSILRNIFYRRFLVSISTQATIFFLFPRSTQKWFHVVAISIWETKKVVWGQIWWIWWLIDGICGGLALKSVTIAAVCDGALFSCIIQELLFHISGLFWRIFYHKRFKTSK